MKTDRKPWQVQLARFSPYIIGGVVFILCPILMPPYVQGVMTKALIFALYAMSLNILLGYTGLLPFGHAAFLGAGGYTAAILVIKYGISSFWIAAPAGIMVAALLAAVLGFISLRVSGNYFLLITFALSMLVYSVVSKWYSMTNGSDGVSGLPPPVLGLPGFTWSSISFYCFVLIVCIICFFLIYRLVNSPFGCALKGIRESETRMRALGYNVWLYKYIAFIVGGLFAGAAGVLLAYYTRAMSPFHLSVTVSALPMLMCIIGGPRIVWGPIIGSILITFIEYFSSSYVTERWPLILGGAFVITVLFLRGGIAPYLLRFWKRVSYGSAKN